MKLPYDTRGRLLIVGIAVHVLAAFMSIGIHSPDEHYQILEFAGLKLGLNRVSDLPWEFHSQMRPALQPALAYVAIRATQAVGLENPFILITLLRLVTGFLSLGCMLLLYHAFEKEIAHRKLRLWFWALTFLLWFLPYMHVRFASETWTGLFFWSGVAWYKLVLDRPDNDHSALEYLGIGALFGMAFLARYQTGLMIAPLLVWQWIRGHMPLRWIMMVGGGLLSVALCGVVLDRWLYGEWVLTTWNYLAINLIDGRVGDFGTSPWWHYLQLVSERGVYPFGIVIWVAGILFWVKRPGHMITWITLPFVLIHTFIGHKELRFLFPLANGLPFILCSAAAILVEAWQGRSWVPSLRPWLRYIGVPLVIFQLLLMMVASMKPATPVYGFYRFVYNRYRDQPVTLLFEQDNPYSMACLSPSLYPASTPDSLIGPIWNNGVELVAHYLKPKSLNTMRIAGPDDIEAVAQGSDHVVLYATSKLELPEKFRSLPMKRVYRYAPEWLTNLNYTNWTSRTPIWSLYEVTVD